MLFSRTLPCAIKGPVSPPFVSSPGPSNPAESGLKNYRDSQLPSDGKKLRRAPVRLRCADVYEWKLAFQRVEAASAKFWEHILLDGHRFVGGNFFDCVALQQIKSGVDVAARAFVLRLFGERNHRAIRVG